MACQLSTRHALRVPYRGAYTQKGSLNEKASLEKGGGPAKLVEGYFVNLFPVVSDSMEAPLSHLRCQLSTRHALRVHFQGSMIKASPLGVTPHGVGRCRFPVR